MLAILERISVFCFAASYAVALGLDILHALSPRPILRLSSLILGGAGLFAHTVYVFIQPLPLGSPQGSILFLAWIVAVFYFYGSIHHGKLAWGLFVLPLVLGLCILAVFLPAKAPVNGEGGLAAIFHGERFWGMIHGILILFASVGVCIGCIASVMYLVQVHRLKAKIAPSQGMKMLSLERIESMNRRAILCAFPLLTAGLIVGGLLLWHQQDSWVWDSPKILSTIGLWIVFAILLYLRYGAHVRGRRVALWTLAAFVLLVVALVWAHPFALGGGP